MDNRSIGLKIESMIIDKYNLDTRKYNIDAYWLDFPIEIKATQYVHNNGSKLITQGRFWIDAHNHKWLIDNKGFYIFVIYDFLDNVIKIIENKWVSPQFIDEFYHSSGKLNDNFKVRWQAVFR